MNSITGVVPKKKAIDMIPDESVWFDDLEDVEGLRKKQAFTAVEELRRRRESAILFSYQKWKVFRLDENNLVLTDGDILDSRKYKYAGSLMESAMRLLLNAATESGVKGEPGNWLVVFHQLREDLTAICNGLPGAEPQVDWASLPPLDDSDTLTEDEEG